MRILVAIANHGTKNRRYLDHLLGLYRSFPWQVDIVVLSDTPKDLGPDVEVHVGAPTANPWSLPFAHRAIFRARQDDYDLFIYSEDDTEILERHIRAFLDATERLPRDWIAGFIRYENAPEGGRFYSTVHGSYYWDPGSILQAGGDVYARYTNDHSGCYILTRRQLKACIRSGGFALVPHEGRYDMLCAAATDPYTRCGFRKTICISRLEDFSLHHLPDIYLGRIGVETPEIDAQVRRLLELAKTPTPERPLIKPETRLDTTRFDKKYFEPYRGETVELFPQRLGRILSVGCERGLTEGQLVAAGHEVVGIPLDSVIAVSAAMRGVKMVPGGFDEALDRLAEDRFDHLLFNNVLSFVPDPPALLDRFMRLLKPDGTVVISFDNARYIGELKRAARRSGWWRALRGPGGFDTVGFHPADPKAVRRWLRAAGLSPSRVNLAMLDRHGRLSNGTFGLIDDVLAHSGAIVALRSDRPVSNHPPAASERRVVGVPGRESGPHRA